MGVKGLWRLLLPIGRRISIETLEGKILAIDASIWLTQFLKAMRDPDSGSVRPAAHLIGFFRRLAKLRFHGIRPVLVFDGATPIIKLRELQLRRKQREQFAPNSSGAIKRMAKRLLIQEIKKSRRQKIPNAGSDTPGLYLPDEDSTAQAEIQGDNNKDKKVINYEQEVTTKKIENNLKSTTKEIARVLQEEEWNHEQESLTNLETSEEIALSLQKEEWGEREQAKDDKLNDWDRLDLTSHNTMKENNRKKRKNNDNHEAGSIDINYLSSIEPHERKNVIEDARRQQRLKSRKEFMPVAGQPEAYSQAQLRNFLRSSRLNKSINEVAKKVAKNISQDGERVAADPSRRIIFEKFETKLNNTKHLLIGKGSSEEETDSEIEWEGAARETDLSKSNKRRGTILDSSEDEHNIPNDKAKENEKMNANECCLIPLRQNDIQSTKLSKQDDLDSNISEDAFTEGGFIKNHSCIEIARDKERLISTPKYSSDESHEGGGFLRDKTQSESYEGNISLCTNSTEYKDKRITSFVSDIVMNTKLKDQTNRNFFLEKTTEDTKEKNAISLEPEKELGGDCFEHKRGKIFVHAQPTLVVNARNLTCQREMNNSENIKLSQIGRNNRESHLLTTMENGIIQVEKAGDGSDDDTKDEESVDWVDGDEASNPMSDVSSEAVERNRFQSTMATHSTQASNSVEGEEKDGWELSDNSAFQINSGNQVNFTKNPDEVSNVAALKQAQSTAANLTNWAGRAVQRAIAQHKKENFSEESKHPSVPSTSPKESLEINPNLESKAALKLDYKSVNNTKNYQTKKQIPKVSKPDRNTSTSQQKNDNVSTDKSSTFRVKHLESNHNMTSDILKGGKNNTPEQPAAKFNLEFKDDLLAEEAKVEYEFKRQNRDMETITDEMKSEIISLIELFGIPYVNAVSEAEAQCVALEELGLVHGIVTEDSDAFVFGGKAIYKNIFDDQKFVEVYKAEDALKQMALGRNEMVALAMLLGGDYTDGVKGVGIVNAMEILHVFDTSQDVKSGLEEFRKWLEGFDPSDAKEKNFHKNGALSEMEKFHKTHRSARTRWICPKYFPANDVLNAYLNPVVDRSTDPFSWGLPDVEKLIDFCSRHMGWEEGDTKRMLDPIMKRHNMGARQTRLDLFMNYKDNIQFANVRSKRLRSVLKTAQKSGDSQSVNKNADE